MPASDGRQYGIGLIDTDRPAPQYPAVVSLSEIISAVASALEGNEEWKASLQGDTTLLAASQPYLDDLVRRSAAFIETMMEPFRDVLSPSTIEPDQDWNAEWLGPVSGTFTLRGVEAATEQRSYITVADPVEPVDPNFKGTFWGRIVGAPAPLDQYRVEAGKTTDQFYATTVGGVPTPTVAAVDVNGFFAVDVSGVDTQAGAWTLRLLDAANAEVGARWPSPLTYVGLEVQQYAITDDIYLVASQPARADGRFEFLYSMPGEKRYRLRRIADDAVLADFTPTTGCVRSYLVAEGEPGYGTNFTRQCYTYDQAVCLLAMLAIGRTATAGRLAEGLLQLQYDGAPYDGGFRFSGGQVRPQLGDPSFRTGAHAIAVYALLKYAEAVPSDKRYDWLAAAQRGLDFTMQYLQTDGPQAGLYRGGTGVYSPPPGEPQLEPDDITWASVEHNFDVYHMFAAAARLIGAPWDARRDDLALSILQKLWATDYQRFLQGMKEDGARDLADPLDAHSWGALFLRSIGDARATAIIEDPAVAPHRATVGDASGYGPAPADSEGYPDLLPNVWPEGTFGLAYAHGLLGDINRWLAAVVGILPLLGPDGSLPYVAVHDPAYELTPSKAVISSAWAILAVARRGIWDEVLP